MSVAATIIAALIALLSGVPLAVFVAEVWTGTALGAERTGGGRLPQTTVLIPAHDEAKGIARTIGAVLRDAPPELSLLVVADNCHDDTAAIARGAGADVVERTDAGRRGKGYALAFGRDALAADPPECVVVLDADCEITSGDVARLAATCIAAGVAVQSRNLQRPDRDLPPAAAISNFAFLVKNLVRQRGMMRLGGVAVLTGTGMAIPWADFGEAPLASADLAEDLALGIWLTDRGRPPRFSGKASTWSDAVAGRDLVTQRSRWEGGFLSSARQRALPLLLRGIAHGSRSQIWLGLHLLVPPLALLMSGAMFATIIAAALVLFGASWWPAAVLAFLLIAATAGTLLAWSRFGRDYLDLRTLRAIPSYVAMKLPLYRGLIRGDRLQWRRTRRAGERDRPDR